MRCVICERDFDESQLYNGIYEGEISKICENCANMESIPLINKPTKEQLQMAEKRESVRERMLKLSGLSKMRYISSEQTVATRHLAKIRLPIQRDKEPEMLAKNYNWQIQMARRRMKMTQKQLGEKIGVSEFLIQDLERGVLPKNYESVLKQIEGILNVRLINKPSNNKVIIKVPVARAAIEDVSAERKTGFFSRVFGRKKVTQEQVDEVLGDDTVEIKHPKEEKIEKEKLVEIKPKAKLNKNKDVTLNDLIDAKREKDKQKSKKEPSPLTGDDIELEE